MFKKLVSSKILRLLFSIVLIFVAFRKVNLLSLLGEIGMLPWWFLVLMLMYILVVMILGGVRWTLLVLPNPKIADYWNFTKANYVGSFYSLFFPTAVAGDVVKWLPLIEKYPSLSKTKLAGSVLIDRIIGFSAFVLMGFTALLYGRHLNFVFPPILFWLFLGIVLCLVVFYMVIFFIDLDALLGKWLNRWKWTRKIMEIVGLMQKENRKRIIVTFLISLVAEPIWILPVWFYSLIFGAGISLLQVYIFVPVIVLILVLPISVAGFGARENLYLYFFGALGFADEKILLVSTFGGILTVLNALFGGIFVLLP